MADLYVSADDPDLVEKAKQFFLDNYRDFSTLDTVFEIKAINKCRIGFEEYLQVFGTDNSIIYNITKTFPRPIALFAGI